MKKPWVVGALSLLLVGMVTNHALMGRVLSVVAEPRWGGAEKAVARVSSESDNEKKIDSDKTGAIALLAKVGNEVGVGAKKRVMVLELHKAIEASLNRNAALANKTPIELPYPERKDFHITRIEQKFETDLTRWFSPQLLESYKAGVSTRRQLLKAANEGEEVPDPSPLVGGGWVVELKGYHYFNGRTGEEGEAHVLKYLIEFLEKGGVELPDDEGNKLVMMSMTSLGIRLPVVIQSQIDGNYRVSNPAHLKRMIELGMAQPTASGSEAGGSSSSSSSGSSKKGMGMGMGMGMSGPGAPGSGEGLSGPGGGSSGAPGGQPTGKPITDADGKTIPASFPAPRCDFVVQFAWQPRFDPEGGEKAGGLLPKPPEPEPTGTEAVQDPAAPAAESAG